MSTMKVSKWSINTQILLGAILGILAGAYAHHLGQQSSLVQNGVYLASMVGGVFIDLLKMLLVPLVFCSITVGIANLSQHQQAQRVWQSTLIFFFATMAIAIVIGMTGMHLFKPGAGLSTAMFSDAMQQFNANRMSVSEFITSFLHQLFINPFAALAQGHVLAIVIFSLFFGIALVLGGERYQSLRTVMQEGLEIVMRMVSWVMHLAPLGIAALLFKLLAQQDLTVLSVLGNFVVLVMAMTLLHGVVVLPAILYLFTGKHALWFWQGAREALVTAFATSSSAATLPVTLRCTTQHLHVKPEIAGFVVPLGATVNMDGTALYEAAAALFIANLMGLDLSFTQQLIVFLVSMIAAIGAPGLPSAGMVTMVMVLQSVGLPAEAIAILLPVDRLLDTLRTTVNVEGDMVGSLVVQKLTSQR